MDLPNLLATGATHCFICARLAAALGLPPSGQPGPRSVATAATGGHQGLGTPVLAHLGLGDAFRESLSVSPMDMDVGDDLILGSDWISSHDLTHLYQVGLFDLRSGAAPLQLPSPPLSVRCPPPHGNPLHGDRPWRVPPPPTPAQPRRPLTIPTVVKSFSCERPAFRTLRCVTARRNCFARATRSSNS